MKLDDGQGKAYQMGVDEDLRGMVTARTGPRIYYTSRDNELAFTATSVIPASTASGNNYVFYLKNTSTEKLLFVKEFHVGNTLESYFQLYHVTGTPVGGTVEEVKNLNLTSNRTAPVELQGTTPITSGLSIVSPIIIPIRVDNGTETDHDFFSTLILGTNQAIALRVQAGSSGQIETSVSFHFENRKQ